MEHFAYLMLVCIQNISKAWRNVIPSKKRQSFLLFCLEKKFSATCTWQKQ